MVRGLAHQALNTWRPEFESRQSKTFEISDPHELPTLQPKKAAPLGFTYIMAHSKKATISARRLGHLQEAMLWRDINIQRETMMKYPIKRCNYLITAITEEGISFITQPTKPAGFTSIQRWWRNDEEAPS